MSFATDAPAVLTQLQTQIAACAAWTGGATTIHYPNLPDLSGATFPFAVVSEGTNTRDTYADGAVPLGGGTLEIVIHGTGTDGVTEALGRTILQQLLAQFTGIPFRSGSTGNCSNPTPGKTAGGSAYRTITVTLAWGLNG